MKKISVLLFEAIIASEPHYTNAASQNFRNSTLYHKSMSVLKLS